VPARTTRKPELERALAFDRGVHLRAAQRALRHPWGWAWWDDRFPSSWMMNTLRAVGPLDPQVGADDVVAELDRLYARFAHRRLIVEDDDGAARLVAPLGERGWRASREIFMVLAAERDREPARGLAREVDAETLRPVEIASTVEENELRDAAGAREVAEQLVAARRALAQGTATRWFVGAWDGRDGAHATLFSDGATAQVEDVGTLRALRGRGLARATVSAATDAALDAGCDLVFLMADDDDWPKELYAKLGFRTVGARRTFVRAP
jgi:GNAT superfamily N-acetyltransferase